MYTVIYFELSTSKLLIKLFFIDFFTYDARNYHNDENYDSDITVTIWKTINY